MSPMLCSESPRCSSSALSTCSGVPARAVTVIASRSTATIPLIRPGVSIVCSGTPIGVKLWPVPTIFRVEPSARAFPTASTIASASDGCTTRVGRDVSRPDQLRHSTLGA